MTRSIEVENLGPVKSLDVPLPEPGGVVVLRGTNGSGKSTIIDGVSRILGGKAPHLSATDGTPRGTVTIGDAILRVTKSKAQSKGELEFVGIEGRLDIAALVDPGIIDLEAADAKRLKALISLAGIEADPAIFHGLCGGREQFDALGIETAGADLLTLAARVKRALDAEALKHERAAEKFSAAAQAGKSTYEGVDLDAPDNETDLAEAYARAQSQAGAMIAHNANVERASANAARAKALLDEIGEIESPADLKAAEIEARDKAAGNRKAIDELESQIEALNVAIGALERQADDLLIRRTQAEKAAAKRATLAAEAAAAIPGKHTAEAIEAAKAAAVAAREAISTGSVVRFAKAKREAALADARAAKDARKHGAQLRQNAATVDAVLSNLLPDGCPLRFEAGRLVAETDRSKSEPFAELSHGERWKIAIDFAAQQFEPGKGLLTVPQEAWESLSPTNRQLIADHAKRRALVILTAAVSDDPGVSAEVVGASARIGAHDEESE